MGLKRVAAATQSRPNNPDSGNGRLQRCSVPAVIQVGVTQPAGVECRMMAVSLTVHLLCMHLGLGPENLTSWRGQRPTEVGEVPTELTTNSYETVRTRSGKTLESQLARLALSA